MTAAESLTRALVNLAADGVRPRCGDFNGHELWLSEDVDDRTLAAQWCAGCPVFDLCGQAAEANDERFGVWAGVDRTQTSKRSPA